MALNRPIRDWGGVRVWLVGASSGIGAALARALAAAGARVVVSARSQQRLCALADDIGGLAVALDVTRAQDLERAAQQVREYLGGLDLVVLNAAAYAPCRAWDLSDAAIANTLETNVAGVMRAVRAVLPAMLADGRGAIAITGSVAGYRGLPGALLYGPAKAALSNFAESLYADVRSRGVSVFLISPGFVDTGLTRKNDFYMPALITSEAAARAVMAGMARGHFEIHFPKRFTLFMKLLSLLPTSLYLRLASRLRGDIRGQS